MTSVSLPNPEHGQSQTHQQDLNVSRMSAGFADVSQLADDEKEKLDNLIERLEQERKRMMATTRILTSAQMQQGIEPEPEKHQQSPREKEKARLQAELKDIRNYNRELERELKELRACLHPGLPPRSSTPMSHPHHMTHPSHTSDIPHPLVPNLTNSFCTSSRTMPQPSNDPHLTLYPYKKYDSPSASGHFPYQNGFAAESEPHYEKLKGGEALTCPPSGTTPMKVSRDFRHRSLGNSPVPSERKSPVDFQKRSFRSLGNSPRSFEQDFENPPKTGSWGSRKVLPDPFIKSAMLRRSEAAASKTRGSQPFDGASPQLMYKSLENGHSSVNGSFSDISQVSDAESLKKSKRHSSLNRSIKASIHGARSDHPETTVSPSDISIVGGSQNLFTPEFGQAKPMPRQRQKRSSMPQRSRSRQHSKHYDSDSLSEASLQMNGKPSTNIAKSPNQDRSHHGSRRSSRGRNLCPDKRVHSAAGLDDSSESLTSKSDRSEKSKEQHRATTQISNFSGSSASSSRSRKTKQPPLRNGSERPIRSTARSSKISETSPKISKGHSRVTRTDTHGSFAPPRHVVSHENLAFPTSPPGSLDTLHGGASNPSLGVYGTSKSGTLSPSLGDTSQEFTPKRDYPAEFDPYSNIHSSELNLSGSGNKPHTRPHKSKNTLSKEPSHHEKSSSFVQSNTSDSLNTSKSSPLPAQTGIEHCNTQSAEEHRDARSEGRHSVGSRKSSRSKPKEKLSKRPESEGLHSQKKHRKRRSSDGESSDSRTSPEGVLELKSEQPSSKHSFGTPEEEMKFLVSKLQGIMPSIHDQPVGGQSTIDLKNVKPMNEVLLAAQGTRQAIRLFAEYAIAVAAGEV